MNKINDVFDSAFDSFVNSSNDMGSVCIPSGFETLDRSILSFRNGDLITLGGRTGMGKTAFTLSLINNVAISNFTPTLLFFLEGKASSVVEKLLSIRTEVQLDSIRCGRMEKKEWNSLFHQKDTIKNAPLYIETNPYIDIDTICELSRKAKVEQGIKFVVIDYLQLIYGADLNSLNRYQELNNITRRLKSLAKELDLPILVVSQINREIEKRNSPYEIIPRLSDMRDSGTICEDSDMVMLLSRPEYYRIYEDEKGNDLRGIAYMEIAKSRYISVLRLKFRCKLYVSKFDVIEGDTY